MKEVFIVLVHSKYSDVRYTEVEAVFELNCDAGAFVEENEANLNSCQWYEILNEEVKEEYERPT